MYPFLLKVWLASHKIYIRTVWLLCALLPVDDKKIVFSNFNGGAFGDNPGYIAKEIMRRKAGFQIIWVSGSVQNDASCPRRVKTVRPNSAAFVFHMSTSHFWVSNTRMLFYHKKKKGQIYIYTGHGGPGMKKIEKDAGSSLTPEYIAMAKKDSRLIDLFLSNSAFRTKSIRSGYWYDGPIMEKGIPKNDLYFGNVGGIRKKIRKFYGLPVDARIVIYVPTWRQDRKANFYHLDFSRVLEAFTARFGGDWYMLMSMHPNLNEKDFAIQYSDRVKNATTYPAFQEIMTAGDAIITDYSSCGFEYMQIDRPAFMYAEDYEQMKHDRGFYIDIDELPCPAAFTNEELVKCILEFSEEEYERRRKPFMEKMGFFDDGHASEAVADYIMEKM